MKLILNEDNVHRLIIAAVAVFLFAMAVVILGCDLPPSGPTTVCTEHVPPLNHYPNPDKVLTCRTY